MRTRPLLVTRGSSKPRNYIHTTNKRVDSADSTYIHLCTHTHIYTQIHTNTHIYVCIYITHSYVYNVYNNNNNNNNNHRKNKLASSEWENMHVLEEG